MEIINFLFGVILSLIYFRLDKIVTLLEEQNIYLKKIQNKND